jgi:hypothetical protein
MVLDQINRVMVKYPPIWRIMPEWNEGYCRRESRKSPLRTRGERNGRKEKTSRNSYFTT